MGKATRRKKGPTHKKPKLARGKYAWESKREREGQNPDNPGTATAVAALPQ